ncbi:MAG: ABC transporter permease [Deltaproteobacteria bacterium]|nr:ABC transporter permease [Deltaproteobacteria bacterium]
MNFFTVIGKNIMRRKVRTLLTATGIGVGIGAIVALVAISNGFVASWGVRIARSGTNLNVIKGNVANVFFSSVDEGIMDRIRSIKGVKEVAGSLTDIVTVNDQPSITVIGLDPAEYPIRHLKIIEGSALTEGGYNSVLVGKIAQENLKVRVGNYLDIETMVFRVVGVYESGNVFEDGACVVQLKTLQALLNKRHTVSLISIKLDNPSQEKGMLKTIQSRLHGYTVVEARKLGELNEGTKLIRIMAWITSVIALAVGMIGTMNTMTMSVFERTKELGILRAIGWSKAMVARMILGETVIIGIAGWALGSIIGVASLRLLIDLPSVRGFIFADPDLRLFAMALLVALCLSVIGALYPMYRAMMVQPVDAIRYE